ncbi:hypothetical protein BDV12DRAFT_163278 [Aspergillus spectabilis]
MLENHETQVLRIFKLLITLDTWLIYLSLRLGCAFYSYIPLCLLNMSYFGSAACWSEYDRLSSSFEKKVCSSSG